MIKQRIKATDVLTKATSNNFGTQIVSNKFLIDTINTIKNLQSNLNSAQSLILEQEAELKELRELQLNIKCIDAIDWSR